MLCGSVNEGERVSTSSVIAGALEESGHWMLYVETSGFDVSMHFHFVLLLVFGLVLCSVCDVFVVFTVPFLWWSIVMAYWRFSGYILNSLLYASVGDLKTFLRVAPRVGRVRSPALNLVLYCLCFRSFFAVRESDSSAYCPLELHGSALFAWVRRSVLRCYGCVDSPFFLFRVECVAVASVPLVSLSGFRALAACFYIVLR